MPERPGRRSVIAAVVLAAGAGSRFDGEVHKLRAELDGRALLTHSVEVALASGIGPVFVVSGAEPLADLLPAGAREVHAADWSAGQSHSLQAAVRAVADSRAEAMVVGLGDTPGVQPEAWRAVAAAEGELVVATYGGRRRPPVKLARSMWPLLPAGGDEGARALFSSHADVVVEVAVPGDPDDVDTVEDLHELRRSAPPG